MVHREITASPVDLTIPLSFLSMKHHHFSDCTSMAACDSPLNGRPTAITVIFGYIRSDNAPLRTFTLKGHALFCFSYTITGLSPLNRQYHSMPAADQHATVGGLVRSHWLTRFHLRSVINIVCYRYPTSAHPCIARAALQSSPTYFFLLPLLPPTTGDDGEAQL